ncbi:hypothetical protein C4577_02025 [Candidatus Parcubacteria bacterium]|nr:MAG: hypothetical protein C4577_02025 [Candidatus Parcubacteria bacterium]
MIRRNFLKKVVLSVAGMLGLVTVAKIQGSELTYKDDWDDLCKHMVKNCNAKVAEFDLGVLYKFEDGNLDKDRNSYVEEASQMVKDNYLGQSFRTSMWSGKFIPFKVQFFETRQSPSFMVGTTVWVRFLFKMKGFLFEETENVDCNKNQKVNTMFNGPFKFWVGENVEIV